MSPHPCPSLTSWCCWWKWEHPVEMFHKTAPVFAPSWCCHCKHPDNRSDTVNQPLCQKFGMWAWPRFPQGPKKKTPDQNEERDEKKHEVSVWACSIMTNSPWYAMCIYCLVCKNLGNLHSQRTQNLPPCPHHSGTQAWKEGHRETDTDRTGFEVLFETATWAFFFWNYCCWTQSATVKNMIPTVQIGNHMSVSQLQTNSTEKDRTFFIVFV